MQDDDRHEDDTYEEERPEHSNSVGLIILASAVIGLVLGVAVLAYVLIVHS